MFIVCHLQIMMSIVPIELLTVVEHHLRRVMAANVLSMFEFESLVIRIEGCVNSRPLGVQFDEATEHVTITPAQLVTGHSLNTVTPVEPSHDSEPVSQHRLQKLQFWHQSLWRLWQSDHINSLQCRSRWKQPEENVAVGDIVLIKEDNIAPQYWLIGRVTEVHPGTDGRVRNVSIRSSAGNFKRAVQRLVKLPIIDQQPINNSSSPPPPGCHGNTMTNA